MKITVICAPGVGDAVILHIVSHHLALAGHEVSTVTPHHFGRWLAGYQFGNQEGADAIFLQHGNTPEAEKIRHQDKIVYTFYGAHKASKHGMLRAKYDYVCDLNRTMVENVILALEALFHIQASSDNGFSPPSGLIHRKHQKRIAIHSTSGNPSRNWPAEKFLKFAKWAESEGLEPTFLPQFPHLEDLISFIYESGYFLGNDSGPGHIASCLKIPNLVIGREERHMRHWRPGWELGEIIVPPKWVPNWGGFRLREKEWKRFITTNSVINKFKTNVLSN
jgi:heptosyltransferase III